MVATVKDMMAAANAAVPRISADEARRLVAEENAVIVDVREAVELAFGKVPGALHIPRGLLEFRADAENPLYNPELQTGRPVILYCAAGGRSALGGKLLQDMGYEKVYNLGGFTDWTEAGGEVEPAD